MEKLMGRAEVAEVIGVPTRTLAFWATTGIGPPYILVGRHAKYRPSELEAWLEGRQPNRQARESA